ncbi:MAG: hypothetical protein ACFB21_13590 [Opitutales bacterium]
MNDPPDSPREPNDDTPAPDSAAGHNAPEDPSDKDRTSPKPSPPDAIRAESEPAPLGPNPTLTQLLASVLRDPASLASALERHPETIIRKLLLVTLINLAIFGVVAGTFAMGVQLWAAPLKICAGFTFACLICLPSFYVFANLSGMSVGLGPLCGLIASMSTLTSLLLLGLAPVVWIFSQSTDEVRFVGALNLLAWIVALKFGLDLVHRAARWIGSRHPGHLKVWTFIFVLVVLQVSTGLRPIIGEADTFLPEEKRFFLQHWWMSIVDR